RTVGRHRDRDWIVSHDTLGPAGRRHQRSRVAHHDADTVVGGGFQRETPRSPEMETVTHSDQPGAETAGAFDGDFDRLVTGEMTECVVRVENDGWAFVR